MRIGYVNQTFILDRSIDTLILDGGSLGNLPLSVEEFEGASVGDSVSVFVYTDAKGKPVATSSIPYVQRDQCASLKVVDITNAGAFLDWGLTKNLLLPFAEQRRPLEIGRYESVLVYMDNSERLAASSRLDHHLPDTGQDYRPWQAVTLLIYQRTDLGFKAVVDNQCIGLLYKDEIFKSVRVGETHHGFIKRLRHDGLVDLALQPPSNQVQPELTELIMAHLRKYNGVCSLNDKSSPEQIQALFQVSKKNFKRALSTLYKQRRIIIETDRIVLVQSDSERDLN